MSAGASTLATQPDPDDEVRELLVTLITFVAGARASHDAKDEALDAIELLRGLE